MFGDDPDPSVAIVRVGFREVSDTHARGLREVDNDKGACQKVNGDKRGAATMNDCSFKNNDGNECRCSADDAMMKCNKQIKHAATKKTKEVIWSVGLGASQHSSTYKRSRPEI